MNTFLLGAGDMMSVVMVIAVARGVSVLMGDTGLRDYILASAVTGRHACHCVCPLSYLLYIALSFLILSFLPAWLPPLCPSWARLPSSWASALK